MNWSNPVHRQLWSCIHRLQPEREALPPMPSDPELDDLILSLITSGHAQMERTYRGQSWSTPCVSPEYLSTHLWTHYRCESWPSLVVQACLSRLIERGLIHRTSRTGHYLGIGNVVPTSPRAPRAIQI